MSALAPRAFPDAPRECGVPTPPCSALRLLSSPAHSRACPFAVARATQVYRRKRNQPGINLRGHRPRAVRPPDRYGRVRAIRDSPSDVAACHRVVRRHICCSPVTRRRSMRATQARAAPGVNVYQPAPMAASKLSNEARRSSEECVGSHESHRPNYESPRLVMV